MKVKKAIAVIIALLILALGVVIDKGFGGLATYWNAPSLLFIMIPLISILVLSDNLNELVIGIGVINGKKEYTMKELHSSKNAYNMIIKVVLSLSILGTLIGIINMSGYGQADWSGLELLHLYHAGLSVALLTIVYGIILNIFFYAIKSRINKEIIYRER